MTEGLSVSAPDFLWFGIHATQTEEVLPGVQDLLEELVRSQTDWDEDTIRKELQNRGLQLWLLAPPGGAVNMMIITQIIDLGKSSVCHIVGVSGEDHKRYAAFIENVLAKWAMEQGCDALQGYAREGWTRTKDFKAQGWNKTAIVIRKNLHAN